MTENILIKGGHIIDPVQKLDCTGNIYISNGQIVTVTNGEPLANFEPETTIEATSRIVTPGFIDLHCHLREPGYEQKETIQTGSMAAAKGGYTTICCMPNTNPPLDSPAAIELVRHIAQRQARIRILPIACTTRLRQGKELTSMAELAAAGAVGFSDDGSPVDDCRLLLRAMEYLKPFDLPLIEHCEELSLSAGGQMNEGIVSTFMGLPGIPAIAEEIAVGRALKLAQYSQVHLHIAHVSTQGSVELIRQAKKQGINVTCEAAPHHLTLTEEAVLGYNTNAKVNPPLRTRQDVDALIDGLNDGTIDIIATDHAPHSLHDKQQEFALSAYGISGFETAIGSLLELVHLGKLDMVTLINKLTAAPAKILHKTGLKIGCLKKGYAADITIIDPDLEWLVNPDEFLSLGTNTPLAGQKLKGKTMLTLYQGVIVYRDSETECLYKAGN